MTITVAVDSFKGSLSTFESERAVSEGIKRVLPDAKIYSCPLADGGEGTVDAVTYGGGGEKIIVSVTGPLGEKVNAEYGIIPSTGTAVIEMSSAAGITLVPESDRNPLYTTTYGVGEIILDAIERGCRKFIIGIGGSATNDGGVGMLSALGFEFLDEKGNKLCRGAMALRDIKEINLERADARLKECSFNIACDVKNPLCGENGCSAVFAPQKGADARKACKNACIGCKKCEKACQNGAITVENNLAVIDYTKCTNCGACVKECPTGCLKTVFFPDLADEA